MVGEGALIHELYKAGFTITDVNPDFVIVGETRSFNWEMMHKAAFFVANGARFIATNPDTHGRGFYPACGALCAGIEKISGRKPFYVGKPSPWIIRSALNKMQAHSEQTVIVGDNLRTDILAGFRPVWKPFWFSPACRRSTISTACRSALRGSIRPLPKLIFSEQNHVPGRGFHYRTSKETHLIKRHVTAYSSIKMLKTCSFFNIQQSPLRFFFTDRKSLAPPSPLRHFLRHALRPRDKTTSAQHHNTTG